MKVCVAESRRIAASSIDKLLPPFPPDHDLHTVCIAHAASCWVWHLGYLNVTNFILAVTLVARQCNNRCNDHPVRISLRRCRMGADALKYDKLNICSLMPRLFTTSARMSSYVCLAEIIIHFGTPIDVTAVVLTHDEICVSEALFLLFWIFFWSFPGIAELPLLPCPRAMCSERKLKTMKERKSALLCYTLRSTR